MGAEQVKAESKASQTGRPGTREALEECCQHKPISFSSASWHSASSDDYSERAAGCPHFSFAQLGSHTRPVSPGSTKRSKGWALLLPITAPVGIIIHSDLGVYKPTLKTKPTEGLIIMDGKIPFH